MRLALRELVRRPKSFAVPVGTLILLALLLLYPSAILDGLYDASSGTLRDLNGELIVYSKDSYRSMFRSRIDIPDRTLVASVPGVARVNNFGAALLTAKLADPNAPAVTKPTFPPKGAAASTTVPTTVRSTVTSSADAAATAEDDAGVGVALIGLDPEVAATATKPGEALADHSLEAQGVTSGSTLVVGPFKVPIKVVGFVKDSNLMLQGALIVDQATWHQVLGMSRPDSALKPDVSQVLVVRLAPGADRAAVAAAIDEATGGRTETLTIETAIRALPGIEQQDQTFGYIRIVTFGVALVVVGLFLSFVTLERTPLYAVLKALGASSQQLFTGVLVQALAIALVAVEAAVVLTIVLSAYLPIDFPTSIRMSRVITTTVGLALTAALGSALSLRRVVGIDPASAIS